MFVTAKDGRNVQKVLDLGAASVQAGEHAHSSTGELNRAVKQDFQRANAEHAASGKGAVRIYYATQADVSPPTIVLFVNDPELVGESYLRFMVNRFRELLPYDEVPIKLVARGKLRGDQSEELKDVDAVRPSVRAMRKAKSAKVTRAAAKKRTARKRESEEKVNRLVAFSRSDFRGECRSGLFRAFLNFFCDTGF